MEIVAVIPARGASKGIPRKNVLPLAGKPLIAHTIEQARHASCVNRVFVSTDDAEIAAVSKSYGAEVIQRPKKISGDAASSESALLHALGRIKQRPDYVVFLQVTAPLRKPDDIDKAMSKIIADDADSLLSLTESQEFIWKKSKGKFTSWTFDYRDRKRHQDLDAIYYENGSIYIFKPEILEKYNNRLGGKISVYLMQPWQRADIDDYAGFRWCEWLYRERLAGIYEPGGLDGVQLIAYDFDGVMTDNKVAIDGLGNETVTTNRSDGLAISKIKDMGIRQIIISSEKNPVVQKRADKLGLTCLYGTNNKLQALKEYMHKNNVDRDKVVFVGNDINDIEVMNYVGYPVAPNDAHREIRKIAKITTTAKGGQGVVRELLDMLSARTGRL